MRSDRARRCLSRAQLAVAALGAPVAGPAQDDAAFCAPPEPGLNCGPGNEPDERRRRREGAAQRRRRPHWPKISGILWQALDSRDRKKLGGPLNDELLGHHGDERLSGAGGHDVLWGDWDPKNNTTRQRDYLSGGSGNDWLYPSHGRNTILGGPGVDYVYAYYGRARSTAAPAATPRGCASARASTGSATARPSSTSARSATSRAAVLQARREPARRRAG